MILYRVNLWAKRIWRIRMSVEKHMSVEIEAIATYLAMDTASKISQKISPLLRMPHHPYMSDSNQWKW